MLEKPHSSQHMSIVTELDIHNLGEIAEQKYLDDNHSFALFTLPKEEENLFRAWYFQRMLPQLQLALFQKFLY